MTDSKSPTPLGHVFADDSGLSHQDVVADLNTLGFVATEALGRLMDTVNEGIVAAKQARPSAKASSRERTITEMLGAPVLLEDQTSWTNGEVSVDLWDGGCWQIETESHGLVQAGSARDAHTAIRQIKQKLQEIL